MDKVRLERIGAASGLVFVGLAITAAAIVPAPPKLSAFDEVVRYTIDNRSGLLTQSFLVALAVIFALWFAGSVWNHIRTRGEDQRRLAVIAFGGAVASMTLFLMAIATYATGVFRAEGAADPSRITLLNDLGTILFAFAWIPAAVWVGATSIAAYRSGALPRWNVGVGGIVAVVSAASPALLYGDSGFFSLDNPLGAVAVSYGLFGLWVVSTSISMMTAGATTGAAAAEPHERWHLRRAVGQ